MSKDNEKNFMGNFEKENVKPNIIIDSIESFIEKKNRYIQIALLLFAITAGVAYGIVPENWQVVILYTLVINVFMELYVLQTKDSILQKKMNWLSVDVTTQNGGLRFEEEIKIDGFFENAKKDFFISGIAPNRFIQKYQAKLEMLLKNNKNIKIYILVSSLNAVPENCAEYYGLRSDKDDNANRNDLLSKLQVVIHAIITSEVLMKAFEEERLLLATSDFVFTISCVAYDLFSPSLSHSNMKITFYQQGEHHAGKLPCILLDSDKNFRDMYPYFRAIIKNQWDGANCIKGKDNLKSLQKDILGSMK